MSDVFPEGYGQYDVYKPHRFGGDLCWYCGDPLNNINRTTDHFWPKHLKGRIKVWCCANCNRMKGGKTPLQFIEQLKKLKEKHPKYQPYQKRFDRMINATQTLWDRIKWSVHWRE